MTKLMSSKVLTVGRPGKEKESLAAARHEDIVQVVAKCRRSRRDSELQGSCAVALGSVKTAIGLV
jgi:hypothetical protein